MRRVVEVERDRGRPRAARVARRSACRSRPPAALAITSAASRRPASSERTAPSANRCQPGRARAAAAATQLRQRGPVVGFVVAALGQGSAQSLTITITAEIRTQITISDLHRDPEAGASAGAPWMLDYDAIRRSRGRSAAERSPSDRQEAECSLASWSEPTARRPRSVAVRQAAELGRAGRRRAGSGERLRAGAAVAAARGAAGGAGRHGAHRQPARGRRGDCSAEAASKVEAGASR